jgi:hypothetical protein
MRQPKKRHHTNPNRHVGRSPPPVVMAGLVPAIYASTLPREMAGTGPAMTIGADHNDHETSFSNQGHH